MWCWPPGDSGAALPAVPARRRQNDHHAITAWPPGHGTQSLYEHRFLLVAGDPQGVPGGRRWPSRCIGGLLGAVALGALAGARRTASAYGRYLASINASDALVNVPGAVPGIPVTRPMTLISRLPGVAASAAYIGLAAVPGGPWPGRVLLPDRWPGRHPHRPVLYQRRLPPGPADGTGGQAACGRLHRADRAHSAHLARRFGVGVGGKVTYLLSNADSLARPRPPSVRRTYRVTAIVAIPPVLVDQSDLTDTAVLPPAATRRLLAYYQFAWVGVRLDRGTAGIPALQDSLAGLASALERQFNQATHRTSPDWPSISGPRTSSTARCSRRSGRRRSHSPSSASSPAWPCSCSWARAWRSC